MRKHGLYLAWTVALAATLGSLGLSQVLHLVPCVLCWAQRILMFPLAIILAVGILKRDRDAADYGLPLAGLGLLVAAYHSLLQWGILHESLAPCNAVVSCATKQVNLLGFITIPFLSFLAFGAIVAGLLAYRSTVRGLPKPPDVPDR